MHRLWLLAAALAIVASIGGAAQAQDSQSVTGAVLAVAARQAAWLSFEAPRPRPLTKIAAPAAAVGVGAMTGWPRALVSVAGPFPGGGARGADLSLLDLASGTMSPLVARAEARESLEMPAWWPDGQDILFQRADLTGQTVGAPGQEVPRYPTRIEVVHADGRERWVMVADGREPSPAPNGSKVVYARTTSHGASLLTWTNGEGTERTLLPEGRFADVAYPRYSPSGEQIAFVAPQSGLGSDLPPQRLAQAGLSLPTWLAPGPATAEAHGIPWDPWIMNADGTGAHRAANVGADEPSVAWSPDGTQLFVYSGTGSFIVNVVTGEATPLSYITGYGPTAWLPGQP